MIKMELKQKNIIILKFGTECLRYKNENRVDDEIFLHISRKVAELYNQGIQTIIVSSGAVFMGMEKRGLNKKPNDIVELQSLAARGQPALIDLYEQHLSKAGLAGAGQIIVRSEEHTSELQSH